jgi:hypothetical protein
MEFIRLTDDKLIGELTFDKSDSFYWLKQQAIRGVASAQVNIFTKSKRNHRSFYLESFRRIDVRRSKWINT